MASLDEQTPGPNFAMAMIFTVAGVSSLAAALASALRRDDAQETLGSTVAGIALLHMGYMRTVDKPSPGRRRHLALAIDVLTPITLITFAAWSFF